MTGSGRRRHVHRRAESVFTVLLDLGSGQSGCGAGGMTIVRINAIPVMQGQTARGKTPQRASTGRRCAETARIGRISAISTAVRHVLGPSTAPAGCSTTSTTDCKGQPRKYAQAGTVRRQAVRRQAVALGRPDTAAVTEGGRTSPRRPAVFSSPAEGWVVQRSISGRRRCVSPAGTDAGT